MFYASIVRSRLWHVLLYFLLFVLLVMNNNENGINTIYFSRFLYANIYVRTNLTFYPCAHRKLYFLTTATWLTVDRYWRVYLIVCAWKSCLPSIPVQCVRIHVLFKGKMYKYKLKTNHTIPMVVKYKKKKNKLCQHTIRLTDYWMSNKFNYCTNKKTLMCS